uniref:Uncharacterized protein n=1 Tax=Arundo donax TaxID=35708 RepID=A0A0A9E4C8_ARUDO
MACAGLRSRARPKSATRAAPSLSRRTLVDLMLPWGMPDMRCSRWMHASPRAAPSSSLTLVVQSNGDSPVIWCPWRRSWRLPLGR